MSDTENAERDFEFEAFVSGYLRWIRHRLRKRVSVANAVLLDFDQLENDIQFEFAMRLQATNWQTLTRLEGFGMLWRIVDSRIINAINFEKRTKRSRSQFNGKRIDCEGIPYRQTGHDMQDAIELEDFVAYVMRDLPVEYHRVVALKRLEWSNGQISEELNVGIPKIRSMLREIERMIRSDLVKADHVRSYSNSAKASAIDKGTSEQGTGNKGTREQGKNELMLGFI